MGEREVVLKTLQAFEEALESCPSPEYRFKVWREVQELASDFCFELTKGQCRGCVKSALTCRGEPVCTPPDNGTPCPSQELEKEAVEEHDPEKHVVRMVGDREARLVGATCWYNANALRTEAEDVLPRLYASDGRPVILDDGVYRLELLHLVPKPDESIGVKS